VHLLARQADVGGRRCKFPSGIYTTKVTSLTDFAALLRRVVLVGQSALERALRSPARQREEVLQQYILLQSARINVLQYFLVPSDD
jgi:hypothetical protein